MNGAISPVAGGTRVQVHAQPGAKRTEVVGLHGDAVKIRVQAPPIDGRANEELAQFIAALCGIGDAHVTLLRGAHHRSKAFLVANLTPFEVQRALFPDSVSSR